MTVVLVTGGFDPIHSGHIEYFKEAKKLGDTLVVGLNSNAWLERKKGKAFLPMDERMTIIENLKMVDMCILFNDTDNTALDAIHTVRMLFPDEKIIFANGGDRNETNIPEMFAQDPNLEFAFGVGGVEKKNSSSLILDEWKTPKTIRPWGHWRVLYEVPGCKVKELVVNPGQSLSMQRHQRRAEYWFVSEGEATVHWDEHGSTKILKHKSEIIHTQEWHKLSNNTDKELKVVEIQYGLLCDESDIERR
jgi:D-beta-D-heptose 7-phosphate kinase/D-beta-D-heptose 1-phosphate adenosyltransferase